MKPQFQQITEPNISCEKKNIDAKSISWPDMIKTFHHQNIDYQIRPIDSSDINEVVALYNNYYPHLFSSSREDMLSSVFYKTKVALMSAWETDSINKDYFVGIFEDLTNNQLAFAFGLSKDSMDRSIKGLAMVMHEDYRQMKLASHYVTYITEFLEASGCDYASVTASSNDLATQKMAFKMGFQSSGIMPGAFKWSYDGKQYYRDMLIYFYKFCNGAEKYSTKPEDWLLDNRIKHFSELYK